MTNRATTECNQTELPFTSGQIRKVEARFDGGDISSDGGLLLLREVDRKLDVLSRVAKLLDDPRETGKVRHSAQSLVVQRVMALAQGYEDLNDQTFTNILTLIDPKHFNRCLTEHLGTISFPLREQIITLDGKSLRASHTLKRKRHVVPLCGFSPVSRCCGYFARS